MSHVASGPLVVVDLSNLCRDRRLLSRDDRADLGHLDRFREALESSDIDFSELRSIADRSLLPLLSSVDKRRIRRMEQDGTLEFSAVADERILDLALGGWSEPGTLVASMDRFDDYRRAFPSIQGSTDRFLGWEPGASAGSLRVVWRDMGVHTHHLLSRKEESAELKARRLVRQSIVRRATETYFSCDNPSCLLAQLWPDRLPDLPRFDDRSEQFVCSSCGSRVTVGAPRRAASQLIVFLSGAEQFRLLLEEGQRIELGRRDAKGRIGLEPRLGADVAAAVSRRHLALSREGGQLTAEDLGSRNGTKVRWIDGGRHDERLVAGVPVVIGKRTAVALPSGITIEVSGRSIPLDGTRAPLADDWASDDRSTRILGTRR